MRLFGIEIRVQLGWVFVLALVTVIAVGQLTQVEPTLDETMAWLLGAIVAFGFFVSSVSHDLAHALVARRRGIDVTSIGISFFGGATPLDPSSPDPGDDAAIAASGPIASLAICALFLALTAIAVAVSGAFNAPAGVFATLVLLNLVLGVINLVPAYPLDGGRIVRDIAWRRSGSERSGWRAAWQSGRLTGLVIIGIGIIFLLAQGDLTGAMIALTGWFFVLSSNSVRDRIRLDDLVGPHVVRDAMEEATATVSPSLTVDTFAAQLLDGETPMTAVPVVAGGSIVGILGVAQIRRLRRSTWATTRVEDVMAKPPKLTFLSPSEPLRLALERIYKAGLDGLPVLEDGQLLGILTKRGIGRFIHEQSEGLKNPTPTAPGTQDPPPQDPTPPAA
jgi:Zn-dependent protease/CBS domain-containing protein